jgi:hypothetical protein
MSRRTGSASRKPGIRQASKVILWNSIAVCDLSSGIVGPRPRGFCSVNSAGTPSSSVASSSRRALATTAALSSIAGISRVWKSTTSRADVSRSSAGMALAPFKRRRRVVGRAGQHGLQPGAAVGGRIPARTDTRRALSQADR